MGPPPAATRPVGADTVHFQVPASGPPLVGSIPVDCPLSVYHPASLQQRMREHPVHRTHVTFRAAHQFRLDASLAVGPSVQERIQMRLCRHSLNTSRKHRSRTRASQIPIVYLGREFDTSLAALQGRRRVVPRQVSDPAPQGS